MTKSIKIDMNQANVKARPFLKWVGGKGKLVPELIKHFPSQYNTYFEPFVGGGALFFSVKPSAGHINDMNEALIQCYLNVRDNSAILIKELKLLQDYYWDLPDLFRQKELYLELRKEFNSLRNNELRKSVLMIFLNKTSFNGMYRENSKGQFNVPFNNNPKPPICDESNLILASAELQHINITHGSYEKAVSEAGSGDLVYFDPPYHPLNQTSSFTAYQANGFSENDQVVLRDVCRKLADKGCKVIISNSSAELIYKIYTPDYFDLHEIQAARNINSNGAGRGKIKELLIVSK